MEFLVGVLAYFLACRLRVANVCLPRCRFSSLVCFANWFGHVPGPLSLILFDGCSINPTSSFVQLSFRGSLDARRSSFSTCEASGLDHRSLLQFHLFFASCSELEKRRPPRPLLFCMQIAQLVRQLMHRQQKKPPPPATPTTTTPKNNNTNTTLLLLSF